jgi:hypothetical protein
MDDRAAAVVPKKVLSEKEREELRRGLAHKSRYTVQEFYQKAYAACSVEYGQIPPARAIQELVTAWKLLKTWK